MKISSNGCLIVAVMLSILCGAIAPTAYADVGEEGQINQVRLLTIVSLDSQVRALEQGEIDFLPDLIRPQDIERLLGEDFLVTSTPGFHLGFVGFNLRRPYLDDVDLRHALFHGFNQFEYITHYWKYTVTPVQSIVPPAQGKWANPAVPKHPFNPGTSSDLPYDKNTGQGAHTVFGIMKGAGYVYHGSGYGDTQGYWTKDGQQLPLLTLYTPEYAPCGSSTALFSEMEWRKCGLRISAEPCDFQGLMKKVYDEHDFDMFIMFRALKSFPAQLYSMCHSSQYFPGSEHPVGLNDPVLDSLLETVEYSLNRTEAVEAAWEAQRLLYDETNPQALPYMTLYSRTYFNGVARYLDGIVNSPGYGSDNIWSWLNWHWNTIDGLRPGTGDSLVIYCNGEEPLTLNPLAATSVYEANIWRPCYDSGIQIDPYTDADVVWQYSEYPTIAGPVTELTPNGVYIEDGMSVEFTIRDDIYWQDGNKFDADDAIFSLNFLRNNQIPQYISTWRYIADIYKVDELTFKVWSNNTSAFHIYNWDKGAFLCPPQVWGWLDGQPLATILSYDLTANTTDTGPWSYPLTANGPKTQLFGTGPFVFDLYDQSGEYADLHNWDADGINKGYFKTTAEIAGLLADLFHSCGDVDRDGWVWAGDKHDFGLSFGKIAGDTGYDPNADLNSDSLVDWEDGALICASWSKKKEYTKP